MLLTDNGLMSPSGGSFVRFLNPSYIRLTVGLSGYVGCEGNNLETIITGIEMGIKIKGCSKELIIINFGNAEYQSNICSEISEMIKRIACTQAIEADAA